MSESQELQVKQKQELEAEEGTWEGRYFQPDVDIYETEEELVVVADAPGTEADNFEIDLRDSLLTITARTPEVEERWKPVYTEFQTGNFMRQFRLGQQIDQSKITASYDDGVLTVHLPKSESHKPRKIEVTRG